MLLNSVRALANAGHEIALVATCRPAPEYDVTEVDFERVAADLDAEFLATQDLNSQEAIRSLRASRAAVAVSVNWVGMIGADACSAFPFGVLNAHAGDLPRYRGNAPVAWAILQGEPRIGITVHVMSPEEFDAGPVVIKDYLPLSDDTYIGDVYRFLERRIPSMFVDAVQGLESGSLVLRPQPRDPAESLRCYPRRPEDGIIHWPCAARDIARLVRASAEPFSGAFTYFRGVKLTVWRARSEAWRAPSLAVPGQVVSRAVQSGEVTVATGDGVLVLHEVQPGEGVRCHPAELIRSSRDRLGLQVSPPQKDVAL